MGICEDLSIKGKGNRGQLGNAIEKEGKRGERSPQPLRGKKPIPFRERGGKKFRRGFTSTVGEGENPKGEMTAG